MSVGIVLIWIYRAVDIPKTREEGRLGWIGLLCAELWFGLYWVLTQSHRWNRIYRYTFKDRLSQRFENNLPGVDVFVCTADPTIEPPVMVINTVLSVMAYDYPPEKLSVYLSDDAGSDLTFFALLEASKFSKHWIPYCKKFNVEPRSPVAYLISEPDPLDANHAKELTLIKKLYKDMENRIESAAKLGRISEEVRLQHKGFSQWNSFSSRRDHDTFLEILIDGRDPDAKDVEGRALPTLVYLAREKRPQHHHNFKAGAMNALIRLSSNISNGQIILNVDCDMSSIYWNWLLSQKRYSVWKKVQVRKIGLNGKEITTRKTEESANELEERLKGLASCTYEYNTQWGKEMGLKYGCPVEDVITGLSIQCKGWKSVYFNPERKAFLGVAPTSLDQTLVQHKRWSEGDLQILLSKYSPAWYGLGKINPGHLMGYCTYCLWAPNSLPFLYYSIVPSLYLLNGISLFPQISSPWFLPFAYVIIAEFTCSLVEFLWSGGTVLGWWNDQRIWLYKRTSSYLFAFVDTILWLIGSSDSAFVITTKVADQDAYQRYKQEMMEFGTDSPMFTILASLAMLNLICFIGVVKKVVTDLGIAVHETLALQILLCGLLVAINFPLYQALFLRKDKGKLPNSVTAKSVFLGLFACTCFTFFY
ncbi:hypothetical protein F0562_008694 [Nyssa sinensis]|uniref:Cellulose synthase-like protein E1 n=1 Tax=Nyssa sinensis TaxID=561372 RepID=A0A5J5AC85_9ASTE|nr:hypothetical protein F0562_008694 [Nyssa sinensis]